MFFGWPWNELGVSFTHALLMLLCNPLTYIALFLTVWDLYRNGRFERMFFGIRLTPKRSRVIRMVWTSLVMGLVFSVLSIGLGLVIHPWDMWAVTALSVVLGLFQIRLLSPLHAVGLLIGGHLLAVNLPAPSLPFAGTVWSHLSAVHPSDWLVLAAFLQIAEAILLRLTVAKNVLPTVVLSKRGRAIGAYCLQSLWIVPLFTVAPGSAVVHGLPAQWPVFGTLGGIGFTAMPLVMGWSGLFASRTPKQGLKRLTGLWWVSGVALAAAAVACRWFSPQWAWAGVAVALFIREATSWWLSRMDATSDPLYVPSIEGVRVLGTVRGSLSHQMALKPGEVITHVNQVAVHSAYDLHFAFNQNPAYAKLQVLDERGEARFVGKPVYDGARTMLGLVLVPEEHDGTCVHTLRGGLFATCRRRLATRTAPRGLPMQELLEESFSRQ